MDNQETKFTPELSGEELQKELWDVLESTIPNSEHETNKKLEVIKDKYEFITYEQTLEELGNADEITKEYHKNHIDGLDYTKDISPDQCLFMKAEREDNTIAYAIIGVGAIVKYRADFLSPAYHKGHGGNHDLNGSELLGNLYLALTGKEYTDKN